MMALIDERRDIGCFLERLRQMNSYGLADTSRTKYCFDGASSDRDVQGVIRSIVGGWLEIVVAFKDLHSNF